MAGGVRGGREDQIVLDQPAVPSCGGPSLGDPRTGTETPIGELDIANGYNVLPTLIAFYQSSHAAEQFEPTAIRNFKRIGGEVERHQEVIVGWPHTPTGAERNAVEACALS